jgi:hypothetical protein
MIRYWIKCKCNAEFEGLFPDVTSFTMQKKKGMIVCPMCDGVNLSFSKRKPKKNTKTVDQRLT